MQGRTAKLHICNQFGRYNALVVSFRTARHLRVLVYRRVSSQMRCLDYARIRDNTQFQRPMQGACFFPYVWMFCAFVRKI